MKYESLFLEAEQFYHRLHIKRIHKPGADIPLLMIHGMVDNGRIFYHKNGKGWAMLMLLDCALVHRSVRWIKDSDPFKLR